MAGFTHPQSAWSPTWSESEYGNESNFTTSYSSGAPTIPKVYIDTSSTVNERLAINEPKVPNAYRLQRQVTEESIKSTKHRPDALNLAPPALQPHGFPEDPNRPLSQRPFSENYPWPYDPSSYYNMARSPTVSMHAKPKAYPTRWEENGGLSRPLSMGGIDLPIPLTPIPVMPEIPENYREEVKKQGQTVSAGPRVLYDQERDGVDGQVVDDKKRRPRAAPVPVTVTSQENDNVAIPLATPALDPYEYVPQPSSSSSLSALWEQTALGVVPPPINPSKVTPLEGVFVLKMYSNAPLYPIPEAGSFVPEHISFGPNATTPFYTLQAHPDALHPQPGGSNTESTLSTVNFNDLLILRRDPSTKIDSSVLTMGLNPHCATPTRHINTLGHDDLITLIYPKAAALAAISSSLDPATGLLPPGANPQLTARAAVERAAETECCRLSFDPQRNRYYLFHPGVAPAGEVYLVIIDDGPTLVPPPANSTPSPGTGFGIPGARGSVKLINVDTSEAVVVLDFKSGLLFINTVATRRVPSVYFIDVAVSTVLAVAAVEGRKKLERNRRTHQEEAGRWAKGEGVEQETVWRVNEMSSTTKGGVQTTRRYDHAYREEKTGWGERIVEGVLAGVAFLVGLAWAVGAGVVGMCGRERKIKKRERDVEYGPR